MTVQYSLLLFLLQIQINLSSMLTVWYLQLEDKLLAPLTSFFLESICMAMAHWLFYPVRSYLILFTDPTFTVLSFFTSTFRISSNPILSHPILSYSILSYSIPSNWSTSHPILSYPIPSDWSTANYDSSSTSQHNMNMNMLWYNYFSS